MHYVIKVANSTRIFFIVRSDLRKWHSGYPELSIKKYLFWS